MQVFYRILSMNEEEHSVTVRYYTDVPGLTEEDLGVHPKRPGRKGSRPARGHEPHPRYKTIKEQTGNITLSLNNLNLG